MSVSPNRSFGSTRPSNPVYGFIARRAIEFGAPGALALAAMGRIAPGALPATTAILGMTVTVGLSAYLAGVFHPRFTFGFPRLARIERAGNRIFPTFDDGPDPSTTPRLLRILADHEATATFFLLGERAKRYPELVRAIADAGHAIGVHGYTHRAMLDRGVAPLIDELTNARSAIEDALGARLSRLWIRPPHGFTTIAVCRAIGGLGATQVAWSLDVRDYAASCSQHAIVERGRSACGGDIVLLHEGPDETVAALPELLAGWKSAGLRADRLPARGD